MGEKFKEESDACFATYKNDDGKMTDEKGTEEGAKSKIQEFMDKMGFSKFMQKTAFIKKYDRE